MGKIIAKKHSDTQELQEVLNQTKSISTLLQELSKKNPSFGSCMEEILNPLEPNFIDIYKGILISLSRIQSRAVRQDFPVKKFKFLLQEIQSLIIPLKPESQKDIIAQTFAYWLMAEFDTNLEKKASPVEHYNLLLEKIVQNLIFPLSVLLENETYEKVELREIKDLVINNFEGLLKARKSAEKQDTSVWHILDFVLKTLPDEQNQIFYMNGQPQNIYDDYMGQSLRIYFPQTISEVVKTLYQLNICHLNAHSDLYKKISLGDTKVALIFSNDIAVGIIELNNYFQIRGMVGDVGAEVKEEIQKHIIKAFKREGFEQNGRQEESKLNLNFSKKKKLLFF